MKLLYIIIGIASLFFFSCKNDSDKNIISEYIQNTIPESWSYEPITFSVTDSALTKVEDTQQFKELLKQIEQEDSMLIPDNRKIEEINLQIENLKKKFTPMKMEIKPNGMLTYGTELTELPIIKTEQVNTLMMEKK